MASLACTDMTSEHTNRRLNMSHMNDMIDIPMSTFEAASTHMMIRLGVVDLDHVSLNNYEGC